MAFSIDPYPSTTAHAVAQLEYNLRSKFEGRIIELEKELFKAQENNRNIMSNMIGRAQTQVGTTVFCPGVPETKLPKQKDIKLLIAYYYNR